MGRNEIMHTRLGEMLEQIDCHAIANGADPKCSVNLSFEDALKLR